jgi:hypothetical protein
MKKILLSIFCVLAILPMTTLADTFEFITFTPAPGWARQQVSDGVTYRRASGVGLVYFYNSHPTTASAAEEFVKAWRARVEPTLPGPAPAPEVRPDGEYNVALGVKQVDAQGTITVVSVFTVVGRGRALSVLAMAAGNDVFPEFKTFLDSVKLTQSPGAPPSQGSSLIDVDFEVPDGYMPSVDGRTLVFRPLSLDQKTPCIYGLSPSRSSSGALDRDARAAILEPLAGWQIKGEHYNAMRGTAAAGWQYFWYRTDVQQMSGGSMQYLSAMAMAFQSGPGQTAIFWGFGPPAHCTLDDVTFLRLFHSLRPRGWTSDNGKALTQQLVGTWRNTEAVGMAQYRFTSSGKYEYGQGTSTTFGNLETRTGSVGDGTYALRGPQLTLTGGRRAGKYLVRVYDHFNGGLWLKTLSVLNDGPNPLEVRYMRVND